MLLRVPTERGISSKPCTVRHMPKHCIETYTKERMRDLYANTPSRLDAERLFQDSSHCNATCLGCLKLAYLHNRLASFP